MLVARGATLAGSFVVVRVLGQEGFGKLGMIQETSGLFALFAGFGLGLTATKYVAEFRQSNPIKAGRILALSNVFALLTGSLMTLALLLMAETMAQRSLHAPELAGALRIGAWLPLVSALSGAQLGALTGFEAFRALARSQFVSGLSTALAVIVGAWIGGVEGATAGLVAGQGIGLVLTHWAVREACRAANVPVLYREWRSEVAVLWRFSLPTLQTSVVVAPVHWYCATHLLSGIPDKDAQLAIFTAANQWFAVLLTIPNLIGQTLLPVMSEKLSGANPAEGLNVLKVGLKASTLTAVPMVLLAAVSPLIMRAYGPSFAAEWPTMVITVLTAGLLAIQAPVGQAIMASGNPWPGFWMNVGWGITYIVGTWYLRQWGAFGVANARLLAYVIHTVWVFGFTFAILRRRHSLGHRPAS